jgi:hypothetical protein
MKQRVILSRIRPINNLRDKYCIFDPYGNCFGPNKSARPTRVAREVKVLAAVYPSRVLNYHAPTRVASMPSKPRLEPSAANQLAPTQKPRTKRSAQRGLFHFSSPSPRRRRRPPPPTPLQSPHQTSRGECDAIASLINLPPHTRASSG